MSPLGDESPACVSTVMPSTSVRTYGSPALASNARGRPGNASYLASRGGSHLEKLCLVARMVSPANLIRGCHEALEPPRAGQPQLHTEGENGDG